MCGLGGESSEVRDRCLDGERRAEREARRQTEREGYPSGEARIPIDAAAQGVLRLSARGTRCLSSKAEPLAYPVSRPRDGVTVFDHRTGGHDSWRLRSWVKSGEKCTLIRTE